jgi:hypothetical protein
VDIDTALLAKIMASKPEPEEDLADAFDMSRLFGSLAEFSQARTPTRHGSAMQLRRLQLWQHWDRKLPNNPFVTRQRDAAIAASPPSVRLTSPVIADAASAAIGAAALLPRECAARSPRSQTGPAGAARRERRSLIATRRQR